jgi:hypothetical protein
VLPSSDTTDQPYLRNRIGWIGAWQQIKARAKETGSAEAFVRGSNALAQIIQHEGTKKNEGYEEEISE